MKRFIIFSFIIFLAGIWLLACQKKAPNPAEVVAKVGDAYLTRDVVQALIPPNLSEEDKNNYLKKIIEQWVSDQVFYQTALKEGLELDNNRAFQIDKLRMEFYRDAFLGQKIPREITVTDKEIEDYYQENEEEFKRDKDEVHLIHLFLEKLDNVLVKEIRESKSLLDVIERNYLNQYNEKILEPNGDLGYVPLETLRPEFRRAIVGRKTGIIYGPIQTKDGFHFLEVLDRQPAGSVRSLELVREDIRTRIIFEKRQQMIQSLEKELKQHMVIEVNLPDFEVQ